MVLIPPQRDAHGRPPRFTALHHVPALAAPRQNHQARPRPRHVSPQGPQCDLRGRRQWPLVALAHRAALDARYPNGRFVIEAEANAGPRPRACASPSTAPPACAPAAPAVLRPAPAFAIRPRSPYARAVNITRPLSHYSPSSDCCRYIQHPPRFLLCPV